MINKIEAVCQDINMESKNKQEYITETVLEEGGRRSNKICDPLTTPARTRRNWMRARERERKLIIVNKEPP